MAIVAMETNVDEWFALGRVTADTRRLSSIRGLFSAPEGAESGAKTVRIYSTHEDEQKPA
jgi:hypothetical protein